MPEKEVARLNDSTRLISQGFQIFDWGFILTLGPGRWRKALNFGIAQDLHNMIMERLRIKEPDQITIALKLGLNFRQERHTIVNSHST